MLGVAARLELEGRVLDSHREVPRDAVLELVENLGGVAVLKARVVDDDVGREHR